MLLLGVVQAQKQGAVAAGSYDLLATEILSSSQASVTFSGLSAYAADYQHLQVRMTIRSSRVSTDINDGLFVRFNGDTAANYSFHTLGGNGSSVFSFGVANSSQGCFGGYFIGASGPANTYGGVVIDILDPFNSSKYPTTRSFSGSWSDTANQRYSQLSSGSWRNTASLTEILLRTENSQNFVSGSRFSLYGIKAA